MRYILQTFYSSRYAMRCCLNPSFLLVLFLSFSTVYAQNFDRYQPLQCSGKIPGELLKRSSEKFVQQKAEMEGSGDKKERKSREKFLLQTNFAIDELLLSGKALFNDPISEYVTRIKDYLLREMPDVRDKIRIYAVKSPSVNAFATNDGIVLVNIGLLAHLKNEAELAFILCHEFQHFIHSHPINQYVNSENLKSDHKLIGDMTRGDLFLAKTKYSRELELEADKLGVELFLNSSYSLEAVDRVFDMLRYSYLPFAQKPWRPTQFETQNLRFPDAYRVKVISEISAEEDYDDARHSHPNISKRRTLAAETLQGVSNVGRTAYLLGEDGFLQARKIARFELCQMYLDQRRYENAIYNAYLLSEDNPNSYYLQKVVAQSIYGLARHRNDRNFYNVHQDYEEIEGEAQQLFYFMQQMEKEVMNIMALSFCWKLSQLYPQDNELDAIANDLLDDFFRNHDDIAETMSDQPAPKGFFSAWQAPVDTAGISENAFYQHALADLFQGVDFAMAYEKKLNAPPTENTEEYIKPRKKKRMRKKAKLQGKSLDLEKVVFVDPIFKQIDERKEIPVNHVNSEKSQDELAGMIKETASSVGLKQDLLSNRALKAGDVDRFNDLIMIERWMADFMTDDNDTKLVNVYMNEATMLAEKYGTDQFAFIGALDLTQKKDGVYINDCLMGMALFFPIPYVVYKLIKPKRDMLYLNIVFDIAKNEVILSQYTLLRMRPRMSLLKSHIYDSVYQMKAK